MPLALESNIGVSQRIRYIVVLILHIFQLALEIEVFVSYKHDGILWASYLENHD